MSLCSAHRNPVPDCPRCQSLSPRCVVCGHTWAEHHNQQGQPSFCHAELAPARGFPPSCGCEWFQDGKEEQKEEIENDDI